MFGDDFCDSVISLTGYQERQEEACAGPDNVLSFEDLAEGHRKLFERGAYASDREGGAVIYLASRRLTRLGAKFV